MKAVAVVPGRAGSIHLVELPEPSFSAASERRGVLVRVLQVGVDGTDREINEGAYGAAPPGEDFLILGHECLGRVVEVGPEVTELAPGDYVVPLVRRPGSSFYDRIGQPDLTTDDLYYEHGISFRHGFLTESFVDDPEFLVRVPEGLSEVGVLVEPCAIVEKGIRQAFEIERRLKIWRPERAAVLGVGTIGLLAALCLRLRGLEVFGFGLEKPPYRNAELLERIGGRYFSTRETSLTEAAARQGPFDLIFEATGYSPLAFEAMKRLGKNGVLVLASVTGGERRAEVPTDAINLSFVLGNKAMVGTVNAHRDDFEEAIRDFALAEARHPGWLGKLLTHPIDGLARYEEMIEALTEANDAIKVFVRVAGA